MFGKKAKDLKDIEIKTGRRETLVSLESGELLQNCESLSNFKDLILVITWKGY